MNQPLRIALIAPIAGRTGPDSGSSIEQLVSLLAEELTQRGHHVTLFATGDSHTSATLQFVYPQGYKQNPMLWNYYEFHETMHVAAAFEQADQFDIIHSHNYHYALPFTRLSLAPVLHTYHINPTSDIVRCYARYPETQVVAVSHYHRSKFKYLDQVPVVYNGIDTGTFPFNPTPENYLVFLGHLIPQKGPVDAIQIAKQVGMRLILAGHRHDDYFETTIAPLIDNQWIEYIGPVNIPDRNQLLAGAAALLFPVNSSEAFGLVMVEAMACGTPVAAIERCAVPEIVQPGVTGDYAPDVDTLAERLPAVLQLDRTQVRQTAVDRFDHRRMVNEYETLYRRMVEAWQ
jgi:glycosyltransferase involved in cell wall biosynthesis